MALSLSAPIEFKGVLRGHSKWVTSVDVSPVVSKDGAYQIVTSSRDGRVIQWNVLPEASDANAGAAGVAVKSFSKHNGTINQCVLCKDGAFMLTACDDKTVNIWSLEKQQFYKRLVGHTKDVTGVAVSPNTKFIVTCSLDKTVRLWNTMGEERFCFRPKGTEEAITCVVFSQEEKRNLIIAGCADGSIKIWSLDDIVQLHSLHGHTGTINAIALSPDGSLIASGGSDGRIQLWDLTECSHVYTIDVGSPVQSVCFSPANYWISVATETGIRIVHLEKKVNFSYIRIVGDQRPDNNEAQIQECRRKKNTEPAILGTVMLRQKPSKHLPWITSLNWSHDGTYLFAGSSDSNVYVFGVRLEAVY